MLKAVKALPLALTLLAGCQQASPPEPEPVNNRPVVDLIVKPETGLVPLTVQLNAQGTDGDPLTYYWSVVGEGLNDDFEGGVVADYTFDEPGEYTVAVTASDGELDSDLDEVSIQVLDSNEPGL